MPPITISGDLVRLEDLEPNKLFEAYRILNKELIKFYDKKNYKGTISYLYKALLRPIQIELAAKGFDRQNIYAKKITVLGGK